MPFKRLRPLSILAIFVLAACKQEHTREVPLEDFRPGPLIHDSLTARQMDDIKRIHYAFEEVLSGTLEEMVNNFKRDRNPDNEIAIWSHMADAYERFTLNKHFEEHDKKDEAFQILLLRSMMPEEEVVKKINITYLTKEEVKELFAYYTDAPRPITIQE